MKNQKVFKRTEKKYLINTDEYLNIIDIIRSHMHLDENRGNRIFSLYFDTPDALLIRRSIDKPLYKEKLRLRAYGVPNDDSQVFAEIKKKYKKTVYKRRAVMKYRDARDFLTTGVIPQGYDDQHQILNEISWFVKSYPDLSPFMLISYERSAYFGTDDPHLRITFDSDIKWSCNRLFPTDINGESLLPSDSIIMEIKISGAMPLWLVSLLSDNNIYPTSFSKVGTAYKENLQKGKIIYD